MGDMRRYRSHTLLLIVIIFYLFECSYQRSPAEEQDRLLLSLALQKPIVTDSGVDHVRVTFNSGPNVVPSTYVVSCYEKKRDPSVGPVTDSCSTELEKLDASGAVDGDLPKLYSRLDVNVTGLAPGVDYDCLVTATIGDRATKCQYAGSIYTDLDPKDWRLGGGGETCDDVCGAEGLTCNVNGMTSVRTAEAAAYVAYQLGVPDVAERPLIGTAFGDAPGVWDPTVSDAGLKWNGEISTCSASWSDFLRFCCCGTSCPTSASSVA